MYAGVRLPTEHTYPQCLREERKPKRCRRAEDTASSCGTLDRRLPAHE